MFVRQRAVVGALIAVMAASGCGGSGTASCDGCGEFRDVMGAFCDVLERCPISSYPIAYRNRDECAAILYFFLTCRLVDHEVDNDVTYTVEQTVPTIDHAAAQACIDWLKTASCDVFTAGSCSGDGCDGGTAGSPCVGLLAGMFTDVSGVGQGQSCESDSCLEGLYCAPSVLMPDAGARSCRVCQPPLAVGTACAYDGVPCVTGAWCKYDVDGTSACAAMGAAGDACQSPQECRSGFCNYPKGVCDDGGRTGDPCAAASDCRAGYCDAGGHCAEYQAPGGSCAADGECSNGHCDPGTSRCGLPDGATCSYADSDCQSGNCDDTSHTCVPKLPDGSPCTSSVECESSYCNYSTQTCTEHCYTDEECGAGRWCNWSSNTCLDQKADGSSCQDDNECLGGLCNFDEQCAPQPQVGDPCSGYGECPLEAFCGAGGTCQERKGPGDSCPSLDSCLAPFFCIDGRCQMMNLECKPARAGEMCAYLRVCDDQSYCDLMGGIVCKARAGAGESCTSSDTCQIDLYCAAATSGMECQPRKAAGETCASAAECQADLFCAVTGSGTSLTCTAGPAGQPCAYDAPCPDGFYCSTSDICTPLRTLGQDCNGSFEPCLPELYCDVIDGCQTPPGLGEVCDYNTPCGPGAYCDTSGSSPYACVARAALGAQCSTSTSYGVQCLEQYRCDYDMTLGQDVCMEKRGLGESCSGNAECASGVCSQSLCLASNQCVMP
jgi:hypothetical protein